MMLDHTQDFVQGSYMAEPLRSHRELKIWQLGIDFSVDIYNLTGTFPTSELYGLTSQLRRAAVSVPANISEGHGRQTTKEFLHYLAIALGSLCEIDTHLAIAQKLEYAEPWHIDELQDKAQELSRMIHGLRRSLQAKLKDD